MRRAAVVTCSTSLGHAEILPVEKQGNADKKQSESAQLDWRAQWWPIAFVADLSREKPTAFTLLEEGLVIWLNKLGQWAVLRDVCPHRLVPLSEGRVDEEGRLQCGYHGWAFNAGGGCEEIPQGGDPKSPRACAVSYPCVVRQEMLWVKLVPQSLEMATDGSQPTVPDIRDIPVIPETETEGSGWDAKVSSNTFRDFPYDYSTLVENLLDVGHVPFTHDSTVSKRSSSSVITLEVQKRGLTGFSGIWAQGPRKGQLGQQDTQFHAPQHLRHTIDAFENKGFSNITAAYCVPISPGRSRVLVKQPFRFKNPIPRFIFKVLPTWASHLGQNTVLEDDVVFLHEQERQQVQKGIAELPVGKVYHMPGASDNYVVAFRNWLRESAGGGPFGPQNRTWLQRAGPRLPREDLLERYHSHTKSCASCSGALSNVGRLQSASAWVAASLALAAAVHAAVALSGGAQSAATVMSSGAVMRVGIVAQAGQWLLKRAMNLLPSGDPGLMMASAAILTGMAIAVAAGYVALERLRLRFYVGTYPPPRNVKP